MSSCPGRGPIGDPGSETEATIVEADMAGGVIWISANKTALKMKDRLTSQFQPLRIDSLTGARDEQLSSSLKSSKCVDNGQLFITALFFST